jgi:hypothetical protein
VTIAGNNDAVQAFPSLETDTRFRAGAGNLEPLPFHGGALSLPQPCADQCLADPIRWNIVEDWLTLQKVLKPR